MQHQPSASPAHHKPVIPSIFLSNTDSNWAQPQSQASMQQALPSCPSPPPPPLGGWRKQEIFLILTSPLSRTHFPRARGNTVIKGANLPWFWICKARWHSPASQPAGSLWGQQLPNLSGFAACSAQHPAAHTGSDQHMENLTSPPSSSHISHPLNGVSVN